MKALYTIILLCISNTFMMLAWYGHLKFKQMNLFKETSIWLIILISWGLAFFEYCFQVPANRLGYKDNGGPFSLIELKVLQEVIHLSIFVLFTLIVFKKEQFSYNHIISFLLLIGAVYFAYR
ncbi:MAG: DMT family protein [Bacteroidia bacterium]|nr:DMT family protein [Bacteroidia bacterium]MDW8302628.1 DMT family protein [Bacteroidia bacterium]